MSLAPARQQQWQQILHLTQQMQELAASSEWQKIVAIESARQSQLRAFFSVPVTADEAAEIAKDIQQILNSDAELSALGQEAQKQLLGSMTEINSARKAVAAYDNCPH